MRVATITAGYGDGYLRAGQQPGPGAHPRPTLPGAGTGDHGSNGGGRHPGARPCKPGDEVVLIGRQGREEITATELAGWFGTIPWEVLTNITYRVRRVYLGSHAA